MALALVAIGAVISAELPGEILEVLNRNDGSAPRRLFDPERLRRDYLLHTAASDAPRIETDIHTIGNLRMTTTNFGQFRTAFFPGNTGGTYMTVSGLWVGGIVGRDTLVSVGADDVGIREFWPDASDTILRRSINVNDRYYHPDAVSEQDLIATYYDTLTNQFLVLQDPIDNRRHRPLQLKITERSYQWSYSYAQDFVLFDYEITNIGSRLIQDAYVGIYVDGDTYYSSNSINPAIVNDNSFASGTSIDDIVGTLESFPAECGFTDTLNVLYVRDNDGDPNPPRLWSVMYSLRHATGVRILRTPIANSMISFNWWITSSPRWDFGPRRKGTKDEPFRDMNGLLGTPLGDRNKYHIMQNGERDYDQIELALDHQPDGWLPPPAGAGFQSRGGDVRYLLSAGPVDIPPGLTVPFTFAYVGGEKVHRFPQSFQNNFTSLNPEPFLNTLDFSDLALNARWAGWIYDNPGTDTNRDGFRGKSRDCVLKDTMVAETTLMIDSFAIPPETTLVIDTNLVPLVIDRTFYEGDGFPDFLGAAPPPAPVVRVRPEKGKLTVMWNGYVSETTPDPFSEDLDFEGYRVYTSLSDQVSDYVLHTSWDHENFTRQRFDKNRERFEVSDPPFTLEQLRALYGPSFDPLNFHVDNPLVIFDPDTGADEVFYFRTQDWNRSTLNAPGTIAKRFPNAPEPPVDRSLWTDEHLTKDGLLKYYEYEFVVDSLLQSVPLYVSVTAFDYGSPRVNLPSLETVPTLNAVREFPLTSSKEATAGGLPVVVYPNPYRVDGRYRESGFEGRGAASRSTERTRRVHFVNLPLECKISIYSLDGDLVRDIIHDRPHGGPESMHAEWDLVSRNIQPVVSGIYYWVVQEPDGNTQMGKLVIIM
ncbi:MAG: hypothetical protein ACE5GA_01125 [Candidatus Zixiibacteriota bacterium]